MKGVCYLCGKWTDMEKHHVYGGAYRDKSEKYGLTVYLCHACHNEPPNGVHHNREVADYMHRMGQRKAMHERGWTEKDFVREFGRNYLGEDDDDD
jgi:hypothetical protein